MSGIMYLGIYYFVSVIVLFVSSKIIKVRPSVLFVLLTPVLFPLLLAVLMIFGSSGTEKLRFLSRLGHTIELFNSPVATLILFIFLMILFNTCMVAYMKFNYKEKPAAAENNTDTTVENIDQNYTEVK